MICCDERRAVLVGLVLGLVVACAPAGVDAPRPSTEGIDAVLAGAVERGEIPGVVAVATSPDGVFYEGAFGRRDVGADVAMTADSLFRIASMTKPVTSVAAMQLVDEGLVELDAPVATYLPDFALQVLEGFDEATGDPLLREPTMPVTVRHLLTHTSGLGYAIWSPLLLEASERGLFPGLVSLDAPLIHDPGARWTYGTSTELTGHASSGRAPSRSWPRTTSARSRRALPRPRYRECPTTSTSSRGRSTGSASAFS